MKRAYASTPEGQIHYITHGRGKPLLLLHATPRSAASFVPLMRLLGSKFQCFAADTLGFGNSDPLPAKAKMEELKKNLGETWFAWSGPTDKKATAYFRIQGPTLVIEYAPQDGVDHIHTIYRDPTNDYGAKFTRR